MAKEEKASAVPEQEGHLDETDQSVKESERNQTATESSDLLQQEAKTQDQPTEVSPQDVAMELEKTLNDLEQAKKLADENWDQFLRAKADLDNFRRRSERDLENSRKYGLEKFSAEMLPLKDSMEMGLTAVKEDNQDINKIQEGMELTLKMFNSLLEKHEIKELNPLGETFNPKFHEAMSMAESDEYEPNTIMFVFQKGYSLSDRLIRPAKVIVVKSQEQAAKDADKA